MWKETIVYAQETAPGEGASSSMFGNPIFFVMLIFGVFYFLLIRPNQKRERTRREMLASLSKGKTVVIKVSDDPVTKMEFLRTAISQVAAEEEGTKEA